MSNGGNIYKVRSWMYAHKDYAGVVRNEYLNGTEIFNYQAGNTPLTHETGKILCLCRKCKNTKFARSETVWKHIVNIGFTPHYYILFHHGEGESRNEASSSTHYEDGGNREEPSDHLHLESSHPPEDHIVDHDRMHDMVTDAFRETTSVATAEVENVEEPNFDAKRFYEMLDAANQPIYESCREDLSKLSLAARMINIKTDHNLPEVCMDAWDELFKKYLPEDNLSSESYCEIQKLVTRLTHHRPPNTYW